MTQKKKKKVPPCVFQSVTLDLRAERAIREGRFQQALELVKQLYKSEPTPAHLEMLRQTYLGRARQLHAQGHSRDAATVLQAALAVDRTTPAWLEQVAEELARCGEIQRALELQTQAPDSAASARIQAAAADAALPQQALGRSSLPASLQADFDRVVLAFQQTEAGQDDDARAALQGIGLRSPFLEWKLLLRGFQAYYVNDDARAVENWQRLAPDRLPARLAAPFRFQIDADFRAAQPPSVQTALRQQLDRLEGGAALAPQLRKLRGSLTNQESLTAAFRQAEKLLPALRVEAPQMESRLASCFYWAAMETGPDDVTHYKRVFGRPADDPNFYRLEALAYERGGDLENAHKYWQKYEKEIGANAMAWPAGQAERVRALIWLRMGRNAAKVPGGKELAKLPAFLRDPIDLPRPLKPSAEQCYLRALELAPDLLEAHEELITWHRRYEHSAKAEEAARRLLEQVPDHLSTLEALSALLLEKDEFPEALQLLQRAQKANPLNRELRAKVGYAHMLAARGYALGDRFDEARLEYQAALNLDDGTEAYTILGRWAAGEYRAGQAERAEELLAQAQAKAPAPLAVSFLMVVESVRMKLHRSIKGRFDKEFKAGLKEPPTAVAATALITYMRSLMAMKVPYYGQKTHTKNLLAYVEKTPTAAFTEAQLEQVCEALVDLAPVRKIRDFLDAARDKFPANPFFPYWQAATYLKDLEHVSPWHVKPMLEQAQQRADALPPSDRRDKLLQKIREGLAILAAINPFGNAFMSSFFGGMDDDDYDD